MSGNVGGPGPWGRESQAAWDAEVADIVRRLPHISDVKQFFVYRIYAINDVLLYVGATTQPDKRIETHRRSSPFRSYIVRHELTELASKREMALEEDRQIRDLAPLFNTAMNGWPGGSSARVIETSHAWLADGLFGWWPLGRAS